MRAAVKVDEREIFVLKDVPIPEIKPDEVLVKVLAAGLCGTDVAIRSNTFMGRHGPVATPIIAGHEGIGEVVEVGSQVHNLKIGDRMFIDAAYTCGECRDCFSGRAPCRNWVHYGIDINGTFSEYAVVRQEALNVKAPDYMPVEHATIMEIAAEAARAVNMDKIPPGSNIVIFGPGPFGLFILQTMKLTSPINLIMVGLSDDTERLKIARELGATHIIVGDKEDAVKRIFEITGGQGADFTIEATGNPEAVTQAIDALAGSGLLIMGGSGFMGKEVHFKPWNFVRDTKRIHTLQGYKATDFQLMLDLYKAGMLKFDPIISKVMPLSEINEACDLVKAKKVAKIVLIP